MVVWARGPGRDRDDDGAVALAEGPVDDEDGRDVDGREVDEDDTLADGALATGQAAL
jgi:hypothetical protein